MAKAGRPKKYNDLVQFNLYIERSDLDILKWVVEETNKKHKKKMY
jgi:succinate dehydrogenase flavin-adding protein (antitoxin of CptAB toxin-antitoxin module)